MVGVELGRGPPVDGVGPADGRGFTAGEGDQLPVGVAADQDGAVPEGEKPVEDLHRLRPGGVVAGDDDQVRGCHVGFGENRVQDGQHPVDVGQHHHARDHRLSLAAAPRRSQHGGPTLRRPVRGRRGLRLTSSSGGGPDGAVTGSGQGAGP